MEGVAFVNMINEEVNIKSVEELVTSICEHDIQKNNVKSVEELVYVSIVK